jgi:hypothetical protein
LLGFESCCDTPPPDALWIVVQSAFVHVVETT